MHKVSTQTPLVHFLGAHINLIVNLYCFKDIGQE